MIDLKRIAARYGLPYSKDEIAQLCFASVLDSVLKKAKTKNPKLFVQLQKKEHLTVLDVGCSYFK